MQPAVVTAALLLGVLLCGGRSTYALTMKELCEDYPSKPCGEGYEKLDDNRCMKFIWVRRPFYVAQSYCLRDKGHLVSVHNAAQKNQLACLVWRTKTSHYKIWIGAKRNYGAGKYHFTDRTPYDYTNWYPGLQIISSKRCVESNFKVWGRWHNTWCSDKRHFVCTREM